MITSTARPRVKPEHGLQLLPGGRIRIGGSAYGIAAEIIDGAGAIWTMLNAADGSRTSQEIVERVLEAHPTEKGESVLAALEKLRTEGYVEDAAAPDPPELTAREKERYDRSRLFYRWIDLAPRSSSWEPQLRLRRARALLVGLGGTGGAAALALAASGVGHVHCVDADVVELSNLNRQIIFHEDDIGRAKVDAAVQRLRRLNSDIKVTGERYEIQSEADLRHLADFDILLLCADRPGAIRTWANRACLASGTPWIDAGYHGPVVTAAAYIPGRGPCYECVWLAEYEEKLKDDPDLEYTVNRDSSNAVCATSAGLSGYLAAHLAMAVLTGVPAITPGQVRGINLVAADHHFLLTRPQHPRCPAACGIHPVAEGTRA